MDEPAAKAIIMVRSRFIILHHMAKNQNKLYTASELDIRESSLYSVTTKEVIDHLLTYGRILEVSEKDYQITPKGLQDVASFLMEEIVDYIINKSIKNFYTVEEILNALSYTKFSTSIVNMTLIRIIYLDYLKKEILVDEKTNAKRIVYVATEKTIKDRGDRTGLRGDALKLTKAELNVINAIATRGGSNLTLEQRASRAGLTPQYFKQLMEELIPKGFVKRKMTRIGSSNRVPTIFLTKKGAEVYNVLYQIERKKRKPTKLFTDAEQRAWRYDYEIKAKKKKENKEIIIIWAVIIGIVMIPFIILLLIQEDTYSTLKKVKL
ncbi:MAG: hypothetical protein ACTSSH_01585 [Candidatus Heimdallarchaeota archaeon]